MTQGAAANLSSPRESSHRCEMDAHQRMEDIYKGLDRRERFRKGRREKDWKEEVEEGRRRWKREGGGGGGGGGSTGGRKGRRGNGGIGI